MSAHRETAPVIAVVGGCGGAGASTLCALLGAVGWHDHTSPVLVDLDPTGGGIDVTLGAETVDGARWSGLHSAGDRLDPDQLVEGLPRWCDVPFLACDLLEPPTPAAVSSVLAAAGDIGPVIVDVGRWPTPARAATLAVAAAVVLVVPGDVRAIAAAATQRAVIEQAGEFRGPWQLVVRDEDAAVTPARAADALGVELTGTLRGDPGLRGARDCGIDLRRVRRSSRALARAIVAQAMTPREPTETGRR
ncbi:MAG: hypothetical protein M3140_05725 [Actinomycetota bacterium]|nr:hypothetical protein [Actinomycetota bacterium]